jgi:hypothetical protein
MSSISFIATAETTADLLVGDLAKARDHASAIESIYLEALLEQAEDLRGDLQRLLSAVEIEAAKEHAG